MRIRRKSRESGTQLEMASMIDIVFLLLVFFVMTFQITALEGDVAIAAPTAGRGGDEFDLPPLLVYLSASEDGRLKSVRMNGRRFAGIGELHAFVRHMVGEHIAAGGSRDNFAVQLRCDEQLKYQHTIDAITALRGSVDEDGKISPLIEKVRFVSPASG